ncbi:MAG: tetraacyldisaccharide 4'-kinase [Alphaproteobacteria bacterium]|nr:tetraacyldisaccharide 4'-kinase [Alphaproteobacteria bacterium]
MPHNTPSFWYPKQGESLAVNAKLLKPLSWLYGVGFKVHQTMSAAKKVDIPVICIGNLSAGGTGKTPTCIRFAEMVKESGIAQNPFFLMRGYGGAERGPIIVDPNAHSAWDVGDESLILAKHAPTIVSADRFEGARLGMSRGADMIVMDDGLQNPGIHKDIKIIVVNGEMGFGNGLMMPAGPLREPLQSGLAKADAFFVIGEDKSGARDLLPEDVPVFSAHLEADQDHMPPKDQKYLAFAGLGYPQKFFDFLSHGLGYDIVASEAFADHCPYESADIAALRETAAKHGAALITTQKDYLRLPEDERGDIVTLPVFMQFDDADAVTAFLREAL